MDLEKIEEAMKKMVESLDKAARLEAVLEDKDEFRVILSKGTHSDRATLSREVLEDFVERGKGGHEVKKAIGKVISKLNLSAQKRR
jgi:ribosome-associated translation inhibitor RaiA